MNLDRAATFIRTGAVLGLLVISSSSPLFGDETALTLRLQNLRAQVDQLPTKTDIQTVKHDVLMLGLERAKNSLDVHLDNEAETLISEVQETLATDPAVMVTPVVLVPVSLFQPILQPKENPYLDKVTTLTKNELAEEPKPWPRCTRDKSTFDLRTLEGDYGCQSTAQSIRNYLWLYSNPLSPMRGKPELIGRLLRWAHAYVDAYDIVDDQAPAARPDLWNYRVLRDAFSALYEVRAAYPGLLLPSQKVTWDRVAAKCAARLWNQVKDDKGGVIYKEMPLTIALLNLGCWTDNREMREGAYARVDRLLNKRYPDGAWPYDSGNPAHGFHNELLSDLTRFYDQTCYGPVKEALIASQWKGPMEGFMDELWTSPPQIAQNWNIERGTEAGPESVATLSGNPFLRYLLNRDRDIASGLSLREQALWYTSGPAIPFNDRYLIRDRNIDGPRCWWWNFCYAGSFRPIKAHDPGRETLMGAMATDQGDFRVNAILSSITTEVRVADKDTFTDSGDSGDLVETSWGKMATNLDGSSTVGRLVTVAGARYQIATEGKNGTPGHDTGWDGEQIWLGLPDRIIGYVAALPRKEGSPVIEINGVLRLLSGGTAGAATLKKLDQMSPNLYRYGKLDIIVHDSNYASVETKEVPYLDPKFPATEIRLSSTNSPASAPLHYVIEVRPNGFIDPISEAKVSTFTDGKLDGLRVDVEAGKTYFVWYNAQTEKLPFHLPDLPKRKWPLVLRFSSDDNIDHPITGDMPKESDLVLKPSQIAVLVNGDDGIESMAEPGTFEVMMKNR